MPEAQPEPDDWGWFRVTDRDTGHKSSIRASQLPHGNYTVLKSEASNPMTGDPLPPEFNAVKPTVATGQQADLEKES